MILVQALNNILFQEASHPSILAGRVLHSHLIKTGLILNTFLTNHLIHFYSKCDFRESAQKTFDDLSVKNTHSWNTIISMYSQNGLFDKAHSLLAEMPNPNLVSYNSLISGLNRCGFYKESLHAFGRLQRNCHGLYIDAFTFVSIVGNCACLGELELLRKVHGAAVIIGLDFNIITNNALIDAYGKCGKPDTSYFIFSRMPKRDVVSSTSLVVAYSLASRVDDAFRVFSEIPVKNTVSWTAMITCFAQNGRGNESLKLFKEMLEEGIWPNPPTYVSILSACSDLALVGRGKQIHGHILRSSKRVNLFNAFVCNALIDMYCKCGDMKSAEMVFEGMLERDVISWNSMITGFAHCGCEEKSFIIFKRMKQAAVKPNNVTFLGLLYACNHTGLVSKALQILDMMEKDYSIIPKLEHYAILIDLFGRKNRVLEAMRLIEKAPHGDHVGMWGALLAACRIHGNLALATSTAESLFELDPMNAGRYVMLSNIYTSVGRWEDADRVRKLMQQRGLKKDSAYSWIDVRDARHEFVVKDKFQYHKEEINGVIGKLVVHIKEAGI